MITNKNKKFRLDNRVIVEIASVVALVLFSIFIVVANTKTAFASEISEDNVFRLINKEREYRGIPSLRENDELNQAAMKKSADMITRNYFEHYAFGLNPWDFIVDAGYDYLYAGENLAMDFDTSEGMVRSWMQSTTHRINILNPDFNETGIGVVKGEFTENDNIHTTYMVTNMFAREKPAILKLVDRVVDFVKNIF